MTRLIVCPLTLLLIGCGGEEVEEEPNQPMQLFHARLSSNRRCRLKCRRSR